jgi:glutamate racemase
MYLGDNARAPYGPRSFETVYQYTLQCVQWFFSQGCPLVVLACNTASAKALRTIQQRDLDKIAPGKKVLGVIRPTTEIIGKFTISKHIGILGTAGTVASDSYLIEIEKFYPDLTVHQEACPMWVPLIENNEHESPGADYFIKNHLDNMMRKSGDIDTVVLACTHYPLLKNKIEQFLPSGIKVVSQGEIVAESLGGYLNRHPEVANLCSKGKSVRFYTTDDAEDFENHASIFYGEKLTATHIVL